MEQQYNTDMQKRLERLEQKVEKLAVQVEKLIPTAPASLSAPAAPSPPPPPRVELPEVSSHQPSRSIERPQDLVRPAAASAQSFEPAFKIPDSMKKSEYWLNKIGIALLLFGAVFLFKYSVEQGWLTPTIRIFFGLALGIGLGVVGLRLYHKRRNFSQVLLGGAISTFYITGYAAFQIFHLINYPVAFSFYVVITTLSFVLSLKENDFIFSLIAILGGLGTPFLLFTGASSIPGLMLYLCILLSGASAIYFFKGWWSLFWTTCFGGWMIIMIALNGGDVPTFMTMLEKLSIQTALFLALPFFWLVPLSRDLLLAKKPALLASSIPKSVENKSNGPVINHSEINVNLLIVITPFLALALTTLLWNWSDTIWGGICLTLAVTVSAIGWLLDKKTEFKTLAYTHMNVGLIFAAMALFYFLDGNVLLVALTLMAVALHLAKIRIGNRTLAPIAHTLVALVSVWVVSRMADRQSGAVILNMKTLADLVVPAGAITLSFLFKSIREKRVYVLLGFALLSGIFYRELSGNNYFLTLTLLSAAMAYLVHRMKDREAFIGVNIFNAGIASWLVFRLIDSAVGSVIFNYTAGVDLLFIVYAVGVTGFLLTKEEKAAYYIAAHIAMLLWFLRELSPLTNGQGLVSVAWGVYTVSLFVLGLRKDMKAITRTAMATLLVLIGKLFLVDLAHLATLWRVLLFMGIGGALLFLSYYFKALWKTKAK